MDKIEATPDNLFVQSESKILEITPGKGPTEVDLCKEQDVGKGRVPVNLASTLVSVKALHIPQSDHGVKRNLTPTFFLVQAIAAATPSVYLISPFVGCTLDYHKVNTKQKYHAQNDLGVKYVQQILDYHRKLAYKTLLWGLVSVMLQGSLSSLAAIEALK
ncbi:Transaldolase [Elasticomyces elasticus]|nr:Transaldolase [Elasticomyces elasticus]